MRHADAPTGRAGARRPSRARLLSAILATLVLAACAGEPPEPEPVSQDEYRALTSAYNEQAARYADEVVACARRQGVEVDLTWDLGFFAPADADEVQLATFQRVVPACAEDVYPALRRLSDDEVLEQYRLLLAASECLADAGYSPTPATGISAFREAYRSDTQPWSPYAGVASDPETFRAAATACPQPGRF